MSRPAIVVENLSKKFRIGTGGGPGYHRLSEMLTSLPRFAMQAARGCIGAILPTPASSLPPASDFWALKDVSFEVQAGEVVGIIGRNGAGKSTLLKILSRITEPTSGRFGVRGRVASLLEVGTGFHPELTGRENIYVSGITLGMTRAEIKKRFDEIVDFSGVEKFLDTPVKHYSSGMQVRLGFAVAAHLESEILIVDEVLAVGDAEFQKKCVGKVRLEASSGRTIALVSHNLTTIRQLCTSLILLQSGRVTSSGDVKQTIAAYLDHAECISSNTSMNRGTPHIYKVRQVETDSQCISFEITYKVTASTNDMKLAIVVLSSDGAALFASGPGDSDYTCPSCKGEHVFVVAIPRSALLPKQYGLGVSLYSEYENKGYDMQFPALYFDGVALASQTHRGDRVGEVCVECKWSRPF